MVPWIGPWGLFGPWGLTFWTSGTDWGLVGLLGGPPGRRHLCSAGARTHGLMRHGPMDWTVGTFWTMGNDALDSWGPVVDCLDSWERRRPGGTQWRPRRCFRPRRYWRWYCRRGRSSWCGRIGRGACQRVRRYGRRSSRAGLGGDWRAGGRSDSRRNSSAPS